METSVDIPAPETAERSRELMSLLLELAKSPPAQQTVRKQTDEADWFAAVLGAARGMLWLGPLSMIPVVTRPAS